MTPKPLSRKTALTSLFTYYGISLLFIVLYRSGFLFNTHYSSFILFDLIISLVTAVFAYLSWEHLRPLFWWRRVKLKELLVLIALCLLFGVFSSIFTEYLNGQLYDTKHKLSFVFWDAPYPKLFSIMFICLQPALMEELGFRGIIVHYLQQVTNKHWVVLWGSAALFSLLHLSFIGLIWLLPFGLLLAYFRLKYRSLWYGVVGHFCYNFVILWLEWQ